MRPVRLRLKNFRSITSELNIPLGQSLTIVGPNNSGKTNILKAINLFFSGPDKITYEIEKDLPFGIESEQTSIIVSFSFDEEQDSCFLNIYRKMLDHIEGGKVLGTEITLFLYFTSTGKPVYKFFSNEKIKPKINLSFHKLHRQALDYLISSFSCKYIPSEKSTASIYKEFLLPFIKKSVASTFQDKISLVQENLQTISNSINSGLSLGGLSNIKTIFEVPENLVEKMLSTFDFKIDDGNETFVENKGSGIQSATLLASLQWISEQEKEQGRETLWLIEEPESYLHPHLANSCHKIIKNLSEISVCIITTHSISFVNQDPKKVIETHIPNGSTQIKLFSTYIESTASIRSALGLRFSDFYNLGTTNVFVEGQTDREIIQWALNLIQPNRTKNKFEILRGSEILDFSGVSCLKDFLRATYEFMKKERPIVTVFDGDHAGVKTSNDLQGFFGNKKINFSSNEDFIILPNGLPIEGLFPHNWIKEAKEKNPNWFKTFNEDMNHTIVAFSLEDSKKRNLQKYLINRAEEETENMKHYVWAKDFISLFTNLEKALEKKHLQINPPIQV